jgi:hypothetical protein
MLGPRKPARSPRLPMHGRRRRARLAQPQSTWAKSCVAPSTNAKPWNDSQPRIDHRRSAAHAVMAKAVRFRSPTHADECSSCGCTPFG